MRIKKKRVAEKKKKLKEEYFFFTNPVQTGLSNTQVQKSEFLLNLNAYALDFQDFVSLFKNVRIEAGQLLLEVTHLRENYVPTRAAQNCINFGARGKQTNFVTFLKNRTSQLPPAVSSVLK